MKNIKLTVAYDGTDFLGWQKTSFGPSIEETLQKVLEKILQHKVTLQAASRTDAGVHARGQVVNFFSEKEALNLQRLQLSLNQLLPHSIVIVDTKEELPDFHPTLDCKEKEYHYYISKGLFQLPEHRLYSWHCPQLQFFNEMRQAANFFVGKQDFSSFCNIRKQQHYESHVREIYEVALEDDPQNRLMIKIRGRNFLYKMVRNLVGTLVYVGMGKLKTEHIQTILSSKDRSQAGITAPAHGLYLHQVIY